MTRAENDEIKSLREMVASLKSEINLLETRIAAMQKHIDQLTKQVTILVAALAGDMTTEGLIPQHKHCRAEFIDLRQTVARNTEEIADLKNYKQKLLAWTGGAMFVIAIFWEVIRYIKP